MKNLFLAAVLGVGVVLGGCATTPVTSIKAKQVPQERLLGYQEQKDGYAQVEVTRDAGYLGGGCYMGLLFRNETIARFNPGEMATFYLPVGEWVMAATADPSGRGLCSADFNPAFEKQNIKPNVKNIFRLSSGPYRRPRLLPL